jgi:hypothetical protein
MRQYIAVSIALFVCVLPENSAPLIGTVTGGTEAFTEFKSDSGSLCRLRNVEWIKLAILPLKAVLKPLGIKRDVPDLSSCFS